MVFPGRGRMASTTMHGIPLGVERELLSEFEWLGIDIFGMAQNHATDYGVAGLVSSIEALEARGLPYAGVGRTLSEAVGAVTRWPRRLVRSHLLHLLWKQVYRVDLTIALSDVHVLERPR